VLQEVQKWKESSLGYRKELMYRVELDEPSAVRHQALIELPNFHQARLLTQLGSLKFRGMFQVHFFRSAA
jgi:hypothetical protein